MMRVKTTEIAQSVILPASPGKVYQALMDAGLHARFTGAKARITARVGGSFSCYAGYITGINLVLKPGKLIVQAWRSQGWPEEHYSIVTCKLSPMSGRRAKLVFSHVGVPSTDVREKSHGWHTHYWRPLAEMLKEA
jgi:uncharacterized protein YndB with AHSA1/START domain